MSLPKEEANEFGFLKISDSFVTLVEGRTEAYPRLPKTSTMGILVKIIASR